MFIRVNLISGQAVLFRSNARVSFDGSRGSFANDMVVSNPDMPAYSSAYFACSCFFALLSHVRASHRRVSRLEKLLTPREHTLD